MSDKIQIAESTLERVPMFPLPDVQLFPGAILPLHIFEPRYVEMVDHVLESPDNALAIATLRPGYEADYQGRPPVYGVMGVGSVVAAERKSDGRWNLLVKGLVRARLVDEYDADRAFREINAERIDDTQMIPGDPLEDRLRSLINQLADISTGAKDALNLILAQAQNGAELTNLLGAHACSDSALRRRMLECPNVNTRLKMACQHMGRVLLEVLEAPSGGRETLH